MLQSQDSYYCCLNKPTFGCNDLTQNKNGNTGNFGIMNYNMSFINPPPPPAVSYGSSYQMAGAGSISQPPMPCGGTYPPTIYPSNSFTGNSNPSSFFTWSSFH